MKCCRINASNDQVVASYEVTALATAARRPGRRSSCVRMPARVIAGLLLVNLSLCCGCGSDSSKVADTVSSQETVQVLRTEVERGPVRFTVELSPDRPRLSDTPELRLTIRSKKGVRVEKPPFGTAVGDFLIRDYRETPLESEDDATVIEQVYTLEPTQAGTLTIAPIAVRFFDDRDDGDGREHAIESEALSVEVTTVLGDAAPSLTDLRPAQGPVELPAGQSVLWLAVAGVLSGVALLVVMLIRLRKSGAIAEAQLSPQELAWLELEQIIQQKLAETDVKEYYVELTAVVRRYIERSTGVHAPEQTTEEFLRQIIDESVFADDDQHRLRSFLESADLVKFAAFEPDAADIERSFDRAKDFIQLERSADSPELVPEVMA